MAFCRVCVFLVFCSLLFFFLLLLGIFVCVVFVGAFFVVFLRESVDMSQEQCLIICAIKYSGKMLG